jgi:hypothetical protein
MALMLIEIKNIETRQFVVTNVVEVVGSFSVISACVL